MANSDKIDTNLVRQKCMNLQKRSLIDFCKTLNFDPGEYQNLAWMAAKDSITLMIESISRTPAEAKQIIDDEPLLNAQDWWEFKHLQLAQDAQRRITHILEYADALPIEQAYLKDVSSQVGVKFGTDLANSLQALLENIPRVALYDSEFSAFVKHELDNKLPYIGIQEVLVATFEFFVDIVMGAAFSKKAAGQRIDLVSPQECAIKGSNPVFIESLKSVLDAVQGKALFPISNKDILMSEMGADFQLPFRFLVSGGVDFVWFHEYGHFLRGHYHRAQCHEVEFEADEFSWFLVGSGSKEVNELDTGIIAYNSLGAILVLFLMLIIEDIRGNTSETYPSARMRILQVLTKADKNFALMTLDLLWAIKHACQPTLKQHWGVEMDMTKKI